MLLKKQFFILCFLSLSFSFCNAQIEVANATAKGFNAIGFGAFLNFSFPVLEETNYITLEGGFQYFKNKEDDDLALIPVLIGYRYTLDQTGTGFYVEPDAGYSFGASTIPLRDKNGDILVDEQKVQGLTAGIGFGYLFDLGNIPFNLAIRYEHTFSNCATNVIAFRISHSLHFGRRSDD
jgi:hypothetical protein